MVRTGTAACSLPSRATVTPMKHEMINKEFFDSGISIGNRMNRRRFATISDNLNKRANKSFLSSESSLLRSNGFELNFCICKKLHAYQLQLTTQTFKSFFFLALFVPWIPIIFAQQLETRCTQNVEFDTKNRGWPWN